MNAWLRMPLRILLYPLTKPVHQKAVKSANEVLVVLCKENRYLSLQDLCRATGRKDVTVLLGLKALDKEGLVSGVPASFAGLKAYTKRFCITPAGRQEVRSWNP